MISNELRIGNWLMGNKPFQMDAGGIGLAYWHEKKTGKPRWEPIPLTEDWLLKFGFMSDNLLDEDRTPLLTIGCGEHVIYFTVGYYRECQINDLKTTCEHVHQLQNLYHALTGQELKIK